jgi:hypothetical protein
MPTQTQTAGMDPTMQMQLQMEKQMAQMQQMQQQGGGPGTGGMGMGMPSQPKGGVVIGGLMNKAAKEAPKDKHEVKIDYKLYAANATQAPVFGGSAKGSNGGVTMGTALKVAMFAGQIYMGRGTRQRGQGHAGAAVKEEVAPGYFRGCDEGGTIPLMRK